MKFAYILTPQAQKLFSANDLTGGTHFILAQHAAKDPWYFHWYDNRRNQGFGDFLILDNGAAENEQVDIPAYIEVAQALNVDEVVLPDYLRDAQQTIELSLHPDVLDAIPQRKRFVVPQGSTWPEWVDCLHRLVLGAKPVTIGIPKWLEDGLSGGRVRALRYIKQFGYHNSCNIHLLGISKRPLVEPIKAAQARIDIRSIDTAAPIAYAQNGKYVSDERHYSVDWFKEPTEADWRILANLKAYNFHIAEI